MRHYAAVVLGCGGLGSAALYRLSQRLGSDVLGVEQFQLGHDRGGSQDHSRIIRLAQHQSAYAKLAPAAYEAWREVEAASGQQVVTVTGGLVVEDAAHRQANTGSRNIEGYAQVLDTFGVDHELLETSEVAARWPQFRFSGSELALYQQDTGIVDAGKANAVHASLARANGAHILENTPVQEVRPTPAGIEVHTREQTYLADRVVIAGGAWTNGGILADCGLSLPLTVTQEQVTYYATPNLREFSPQRFPVFMWHGAHNFYGFPIYGEVATKLGEHMGGPEVTAQTRTFDPDPARQKRYWEFLETHIPGFAGPEVYTKTCLYTVPPDQNFVLDTLPADPRVVVAVGAGHAFKFAALIGTILAELACDGGSTLPIEAFALTRPALTDPNYVKTFHT